jgi:hypothetical protein
MKDTYTSMFCKGDNWADLNNTMVHRFRFMKVRWLFLSILVSWLYLVTLYSQISFVDGFASASETTSLEIAFVPFPCRYSSRRQASQNDATETLEDSPESGNLWSSPTSSVTTFNPFAYGAASVSEGQPRWMSSQPSKERTNTNNIISLRSTRMKQITNEMLNAFPNHGHMLHILQSHQEFLLEPLEDDMAVQDVDSIYRTCANRTERYRRFEQSMTDRLHSVRDESVRQVLMALKNFVLSHEHPK